MAISRNMAGDLRGLRDRIAGMTTPAFRMNLAQRCGAAALKLVADEFNKSQAPDGTAWEPLASRRGKPLLDTGRLRASFTVQPADGFFRIGTAVGYAAHHQFGTKPRQVAERGAKQNARGRFVRSNRSGYLLRIRAHQNRGIPARPMLPTGAIPPAWTDVFAKEIRSAVAQQLKGAA